MDTTSDNKLQSNTKSSSMTTDALKKAGSRLLDNPITDEIVNKAEWIKEESVEAYESSIQWIRRNPVRSVAMATGIGVILGMIFKSRR